VRHSSLHRKPRASVLINALMAVIVLMGATAPRSAQEPLNLMNPLSYGSAFTEATHSCRERQLCVWFTDHSDCRLTDELTIPTGVTLEGLGYLTSRITVDTPPGRRGLVYAAPRITEAGITIRGLRLIGANTAVGDLLTFQNATDVAIERASIRTTGGTAIVFDYCIGCHVLYSRVETFRCTADATLTLLSRDGKIWVELTRSVN
jgi:hypothetical protein